MRNPRHGLLCIAITRAVLAVVLTSPLSHVAAQAIGERAVLDVDNAQDTPGFKDEQAGVRAGAFQLLPSAAVSVAYDSNLFAAPGEREEQAVSIVEAMLRAASTPGDLDLRGGTFLRARRFMDAGDQDTTEFGASGDLRAQLGPQDEFTGRLLAERRAESRTEIETPHFGEPSLYHEFRGDLAYTHTFSRFALRARASGRRLDYEDTSQSFRDQWSHRAELRGAYAVHSGLSLIATGYYDRDVFSTASTLVASAKTTGALIGARLRVPDVADLELSAGHFQRTFERQLGEISGVSLRGAVTWYPTRLLTVRADLLREDEPTRLLGAFGKIRTNGSLELDHEYSRRLSLYARGRMIVDDFESIHRTDKTYFAEVGAAFLLTRRYMLSFEYDYATRSSGADSESFVRHLMDVSFIGRF